MVYCYVFLLFHSPANNERTRRYQVYTYQEEHPSAVCSIRYWTWHGTTLDLRVCILQLKKTLLNDENRNPSKTESTGKPEWRVGLSSPTRVHMQMTSLREDANMCPFF